MEHVPLILFPCSFAVSEERDFLFSFLFLFFVLVFSKRGGVEGEGEGNCDLTISRISNIFGQKKQKMMRKTSRAGEQHQSGHQEEDEDEQDEDEQDEQLEREQQKHGQEEQEQ